MPVRAARSLARLVLTLGAVCVLVFLLTELLPGDAASVLAGAQADPQRLAALREAAGLTDPAWVRFGRWFGGLATGDLGHSLVDGRPVGTVLAERLAATVWIAIPAWALAVTAGTAAALALGWHHGRRGERAGSAAVAAVAGVPEAVLVTLLVVLLAGTVRMLPPVSLIPAGGSPADRPAILVLPVLATALPLAAWTARLLRGPATDALRRPWVSYARRRGLPATRVLLRHGLPHLAAPLGQLAPVLAAAALGSTAVVEALLAYPGLGALLATAVANRDVPVVQGTAVVLAGLVLAGLAAGDALANTLARRAGAR